MPPGGSAPLISGMDTAVPLELQTYLALLGTDQPYVVNHIHHVYYVHRGGGYSHVVDDNAREPALEGSSRQHSSPLVAYRCWDTPLVVEDIPEARTLKVESVAHMR